MAEDTRSLKDRLLYTSSAPNDDRNRMRTVANNLILHIHPTKVPLPALRLSYTWGLGGISALLATLLVITGVMLMFRYDASVERAYVSIQMLETQVTFGYLLPWDQLAFWAITVGASLLDYIPLLGPAVAKLLLGGPEVGQAALRNFYALHVAVLPALLILAMSFHFWKVRKDGGISQPEGPQRVEKVTTIPHLVQIEMAAAALLAQVAALGPEGESWAAGMQTFAENCTICHGIAGEGSDLGVALNSAELRAKDTDTLARTIREGAPGTMMASWSKVLDDDEIADVVAFLRDWDAVEAAGLQLTAPAPIEVDLNNPEEILALGQRIFDTTCSACHGENGSGGSGPVLNSQQILTRNTDEQLRAAIVFGGRRPNSTMPAFGDRMTSVEIEAVVQYLRSWEPTAPQVANPRGSGQGGGPRPTPTTHSILAKAAARRPAAAPIAPRARRRPGRRQPLSGRRPSPSRVKSWGAGQPAHLPQRRRRSA